MDTMEAVVFRGVHQIRVEEAARPRPRGRTRGRRMTATTTCGTGVHIVNGEYPVRPGLVLGCEPVGVIAEFGEGLSDD